MYSTPGIYTGVQYIRTVRWCTVHQECTLVYSIPVMYTATGMYTGVQYTRNVHWCTLHQECTLVYGTSAIYTVVHYTRSVHCCTVHHECTLLYNTPGIYTGVHYTRNVHCCTLHTFDTECQSGVRTRDFRLSSLAVSNHCNSAPTLTRVYSTLGHVSTRFTKSELTQYKPIRT